MKNILECYFLFKVLILIRNPSFSLTMFLYSCVNSREIAIFIFQKYFMRRFCSDFDQNKSSRFKTNANKQRLITIEQQKIHSAHT